MLTILMLMLATSPQPALKITWSPTGVTLDQAMYDEFEREKEKLSDDKKPTNDQENTCLFARYLMMQRTRGQVLRTVKPDDDILKQARDYSNNNCTGGGPGKPLTAAGQQRLERGVKVLIAKYIPWVLPPGDPDYRPIPLPAPRPKGVQRTAAPFSLPPLPDKAGGDLGPGLWVMFQTLEAKLAAGGHPLTGEARACAWASGALSAAQAVLRTPAATEGIAAGAKVLEAKRATTCQGPALAQKEAAWAWIRANPQASQALEVARRAPAPIWPAPSSNDPVLWLGTGMLFLVAPEAVPVILLAR